MVFGGNILSGTGLLIVAGVIIFFWVLIEIKAMKHKIFAIFLMILVLVMYMGAIVVFKDTSYDLSTPSGVMDATKVYFSWLGSVFVNLKNITTNAIHMDWSANSTSDAG